MLEPETKETAEFLAACAEEAARRWLQNFIPWATPDLRSPSHFSEITQCFEDGLTKAQRVCFSAPPQFGKTTTIIHGLIWDKWRRPGGTSAYVTYGTEPARARANEARQILQRLPFLKAQANTERIRFSDGSQIIFTSVDGPLESHAVTRWLVVDDPYKNSTEAASPIDRKNLEEWFFGTAYGRLHQSTSVMVNHHRWTEHDLIVKLKPTPWKEATNKSHWKHKNYSALLQSGRSLWEDLKSAEMLRSIREEIPKSVWEAVWQGNPLPEGGRLFKGLHYFEPQESFTSGFTVGIGIDCAYGDKKGADWNVIVVLARKGRTYHVLEVHRSHEPSPQFEQRLKRVQTRYPGSPTRWYPGPPEMGLAQRLARECKVQIPPAEKKKKLRAEHCAAAWNADPSQTPPKPPLILVPRGEPHWLSDFAQEILDFTGNEGKDLHDDQVDALAAAFDVLSEQSTTTIYGMRGSSSVGQWGGLITPLH